MSSSLNIPNFSSGSVSSPFERATTPNQRLSSPRYERNEVGDVEFRYEIDVSDYRPEEVKISQSGHTITIDASCVKTTKAQEEASSCSRSEKKEYHKTITLPQNADLTQKLQTFFDGGKLIIKLPVTTSSYSSTGYLNLSSSTPSSGMSMGQYQSPLYTHSRVNQPDSSFFGNNFETNYNQSKCYFERLNLDPEFSKNDIKVSVNGQMVHVNARRKENDAHGCVSTRQYNSEHKFPPNTDLDEVKADWSHGELIISAPYK